MKRLNCVLLLFFLKMSLAGCLDSVSIESCKQLEADGKITEAVLCYKTLIETEDSIAAYERLSIINGSRGDYEKAIAYGQRVFTSNQQNLSNKMNLGNWFFKTGQATNALNHFLMVERVDSLFPKLNYNLAVVYLTQFNAPQLARKHMERELREFGYSEENLAIMAQIYFQLDLYENSEIAYSRVISENPTNAIYYFQRAILYYYWDKDSDAISDLDTAIKLNPEFADAMLLKIDIGLETDASYVCDLIYQVENLSVLSEDLMQLKNQCLNQHK